MALIIFVLNSAQTDVNIQLTGVYAVENELFGEKLGSQKNIYYKRSN